jgi:hypothetical protein
VNASSSHAKRAICVLEFIPRTYTAMAHGEELGEITGVQENFYEDNGRQSTWCPVSQGKHYELLSPYGTRGQRRSDTLNGYLEPHRLPHNMFATVRIKMTASWLMRYLSIGLHGPRSP